MSQERTTGTLHPLRYVREAIEAERAKSPPNKQEDVDTIRAALDAYGRLLGVRSLPLLALEGPGLNAAYAALDRLRECRK